MLLELYEATDPYLAMGDDGKDAERTDAEKKDATISAGDGECSEALRAVRSWWYDPRAVAMRPPDRRNSNTPHVVTVSPDSSLRFVRSRGHRTLLQQPHSLLSCLAS